MQNRSMLGLIAKGAVRLAQALGTAAAFAIANPFKALIGVGVAAAAVAGIIAATSKSQTVKDGMAPSSKGPFTITDNFGATAVTTTGDNVVVSPNVNKGNNTNNISMNETNNIMKEQNQLLAGILSKPNFESKFSGGYGNSVSSEGTLKYGNVNINSFN